MFSNTMPLSPFLSLFTSKIKRVFKEYLDNKIKLRKTFINTIKRIKYLQYLVNPQQKINKTDKIKKK